MSFQGKTVWITGASSGIGAALAQEFAQTGATLILSARRKEALEQVKEQCNSPQSIHIVPLDLAQSEKMLSKVEEVMRLTGRIDVLINNGGISQRALILDTDLEVYRKLMEVNYFGTIALSKAVLPVMVRQQSGHIATITSLMGKFSSPLRSGYAGAKHALHGFFDALRAEHYKDNIGVTMVCPGYISTDISLNALSGSGEKHGKMDNKQAQGISAAQCAAKIRRAIHRKKQEVYIGKSEILGIYLKRFFPRLLARVIRKVKVT